MREKYWLLDRFIGKECKVFSRPIDNDAVDNEYIIKSFYYEMDEFFLRLKDATNNQVKTTVRLDEISDIFNLGDDVDIYDDLVKVKTHYHTTYYIKINEKRPVPIKCHKCGKEINFIEDKWFIHGYDSWLNAYDGDLWQIHELSFCTECVSNLIGELADDNPYRDIDFGGECHE